MLTKMLNPAGDLICTIWYTLSALVLLCPESVIASCIYPDYMYGTAFPWMVRSSAGPSWQKKGYQEVAFHGDHARIKHTKSREPEHIVQYYTYRCVLEVNSDTVVVQVETEGSDVPGNYTCIQFVKRTINVVQWRIGDSSTLLDKSICDNRTLVLEAAPLVYYPHSSGFWNEERNAALEYEPCPAVGGYIIRQWFNETGAPLCDFTKMIPMKLENECSTGEGIKLVEIGCRAPWNFPKEYFCLTSWQDDNFLYMVLWFTGINYFVPCLRFPLHRDRRFNAHFFLDGACDTGVESIEHSISYARWMMEHTPSTGMCTDDSQMCHSAPLVNCSQVSHLCRESCRACPTVSHFDKHWENLPFPEGFQGTWLKHSFDLGTEVVMVEDNSLHIPSLGSFTNGGVSQCTRTVNRRYGLPYNAEEFSLLTFFDNGCSPHGTSIVIGNWSTSVASFRITISKAIIKPFLTVYNPSFTQWTIRNSFESLCDNFALNFYETDPEPIGTRYRVFPNGWFNLVRMNEPLIGVSCLFPVNFLKMTMRLHTGAECDVRMKSTEVRGNEPLSGDTVYEATSFNLVIESCTPEYEVEENSPPDGEYVNSTTTSVFRAVHAALAEPPVLDKVRAHQIDSHLCLASFRDRYQNRYLITKVTSSESIVHQQYLCWLFSSRTGRAYWLPISSCDSNIERQLGRRNYEPYAVIDVATSLTNSMDLILSISLLITLI